MERNRYRFCCMVVMGIFIVTFIGLGVTFINTTVEQSAQIIPTHTSTSTATVTLTLTPTPTVTPSPTPTPIPVSVIIGAINQTAFLETVRATLNLPNVYAENDQPGILPGKRSLYYNANITVTAGIDFNLLSAANISVNGTSVTIRLPQPQVRDCVLDESTSYYYDRKCDAAGVVDIGCGGLEDDLRQRALQVAAQADHQQLQEEAFKGASEIVRNLVLTVGGVQEVIIERAPAPLAMLSDGGTCQLHSTGG